MKTSARSQDVNAGFTLPEIMITLLLTAMMCVAVFMGLQTASKLTLGTSIRSEAHRLLQAEAERLESADFGSFIASADQSITSNFRTTFLAGNEAQFSYPAGASGRITFTRRVVAVAATSTSRTLRVEVQWTWQGRDNLVSVTLFRTQ